MSKTAGILVIGNEILSGKTADENSVFLVRELRDLGVDVRKISVIADDVETIAQEVRWFSKTYDYVFTTGGVGPTHDDLTMEGIARSFGQKISGNGDNAFVDPGLSFRVSPFARPVVRNENARALFVVQLDARGDDFALKNFVFKLDRNIATDVDRRTDLTHVRSYTRGTKPNDLVPGRGLVVVPNLFRTGLRLLVKVFADDVLCFTVISKLSILQPDHTLAQTRDRLHVMRDEDHGTSRLTDVTHFAKTLSLEPDVTDREHFIDDKDLGIEMSSDREGEPHVHARRVMLHRCVEKSFDLGERNDLIELLFDLGPLHAEDRTIEVNVLATRELGMKSCADFKKTSDTSADRRCPARRFCDA